MSTFAPTRCAAVALTIAALGLAGCGRRGDLEPDPASGISAKQAREQAKDAEQNQPLDGTAARRLPRGIVPPKEPFILDPLL